MIPKEDVTNRCPPYSSLTQQRNPTLIANHENQAHRPAQRQLSPL